MRKIQQNKPKTPDEIAAETAAYKRDRHTESAGVIQSQKKRRKQDALDLLKHLPQETIEIANTFYNIGLVDGHEDWNERVFPTMKKMEVACDRLDATVQSVCDIIDCDTSPRTRQKLKDRWSDISKYSDELKAVVRGINIDPLNPVWVNEDWFESEDWTNLDMLRLRVGEFIALENQGGYEARLDDLRNFIKTANFQSATESMAGYRGTKGRGSKEDKLAIEYIRREGQALAKQRGYTSPLSAEQLRSIGKALYQELEREPHRNNQQRAAFARLSHFTYVLPGSGKRMWNDEPLRLRMRDDLRPIGWAR